MEFCLRILSLLLLITPTLTDEGFNLEDAFGPDPTPEKPKEQPESPKLPGGNGDLNLLDAFGPGPTPKPKKPSSGGTGDDFGFDLSDALLPGATSEPKQPAVKPPSGGGGGTFDDNDLLSVGESDDYKPDKGGSGGRAMNPGSENQGGADQPQEAGSGPIAGIISAVGVALVGAASSYFAYQKKKLCFKLQGGADPESGKTQQGGQNDNQVFSNLLQKS
uniref:CD99 antigen 2-like protein n=1 Tax=Fundulus heteroclitus TaxID=8078 RepID=A0A146T3K7_FUNHE